MLLPETFGMQMPNNIADAIDLVPEKKESKDQELLPHKLDSNSTVNDDDDDSNLSKPDVAC